MKNRTITVKGSEVTVLFLGMWEQLNSSGFNSLEFAGIKNEAARNSYIPLGVVTVHLGLLHLKTESKSPAGRLLLFEVVH